MKFSVIIPVFNAEKYLSKCLESIINQTYDNWEVIALDDGSQDNSFSIMKKYSRLNGKIKVATKSNEGPGLTRNRALEMATGDYIVYVDADDYIEPDYFELLNNKIEEEHADVIFIDVIQESADGTVYKYEKMSDFANKNRKDLLGCQMTGFMPWGGCRKVASKSLILNNNIKYSQDPTGEEAIYSFELLRNAKKISFIEKNLYHYINHLGSQSKSQNCTWEVTLNKMNKHLEEKKIRDYYLECICSFAFTVMISWLLREIKRESIWKCRKNFIVQIDLFKKEYGWNIRKDYLRKEVRLLYPIVRHNILLPIVISAKFVKKY